MTTEARKPLPSELQRECGSPTRPQTSGLRAVRDSVCTPVQPLLQQALSFHKEVSWGSGRD